MNVVELRSVTKRFDQFVAVRDLSLNVREGTIFGLLGPNGAGKTTSIRMIVNIFAPDEGDVLVMGKHVSPELQPHIGYLPEERGLYKKMKIGDQLVFFANIKGLDSREASRRADQMGDDICLVNHGRQVLSGGLKEVKGRYGKNTVILDYEGPDSIFGDDLVKRHSRFPNYSEILLQEGADGQEVLRRAIAAGARVNRFELVEPSLNEIFIESVTGKISGNGAERPA